MAKPVEKEVVVIEPVEEEKIETITVSADIERWHPKTELGSKDK